MFSKLLNCLSTATDSQWIESFSSVVASVENGSLGDSVPRNRDIHEVFVLIESKLATSSSNNKLVSVLLDALRVLLRFRENVEESLTTKLINHLLNISGQQYYQHNPKNNTDNTDSAQNNQKEQLLTAQLAARCLINLLFDNPANMCVFTSMNGIDRIVSILNTHYEYYNQCTVHDTNNYTPTITNNSTEHGMYTVSDEVNTLHYFLVRVVHMLVSQSDAVRTMLVPSEPLTLQLVEALVRRLSMCVGSGVSTGTTNVSGGDTNTHSGATDNNTSNTINTTIDVTTNTNCQPDTHPTTTTTTTTNTTFPGSDSVGKLYTEVARLLFALECHTVLECHTNISSSSADNSKGEKDTATNNTTCTNANTSDNDLTTLLTITILSAVVHSTAPYTTDTTATAPTHNSTTTTTTQQLHCQDVSMQLAMFLPTQSYAHPALLAALHRLLGTTSSDGGSIGGGVSSSDGIDVSVSGSSSGDGVGNSSGSDDNYTGTSNADKDISSTSIVVHIVPYLLSILYRQLLQAYGEYNNNSTDSSGSSTSSAVMRPSEQSALLTPILVLLNNLCTHNHTLCTTLKTAIFPTPYTTSTPLTTTGTAKMDPSDVPYGSVRYYLVRLMTSLDSQLKRCVAELLFVLCEEDADEFTARTGFGNAVALLQIKGLC